VVDYWNCPCTKEFERLARLPIEDIEPHLCTQEDDDDVSSRRTTAELMDTGDSSGSSQDAEMPRQIGHYIVLGKMGSAPGLFKVRHEWTSRIFVMKAIKKGDPSSWEDRYRDEALSSLHFGRYLRYDTEHTVHVIDVRDDADYHFITMEYLGRGSLTRHRAAFSNPARAVPLVGHLAIVVHHSYRQLYDRRKLPQFHLKPDNVLFDDDGKPLLTGFEWAPFEKPNTSSRGTVAYMSPEQLTGDRDSFRKIDVWTLGVILYELVTGQLPFQGATTDDLRHAILNAESRPLRSLNRKIDKKLNAIIMKCLARDEKQRYDGAATLADQLCGWHRRRSYKRQGFILRVWYFLWGWWG
jgi:serine/threonine protein kinase